MRHPPSSADVGQNSPLLVFHGGINLAGQCKGVRGEMSLLHSVSHQPAPPTVSHPVSSCFENTSFTCCTNNPLRVRCPKALKLSKNSFRLRLIPAEHLFKGRCQLTDDSGK